MAENNNIRVNVRVRPLSRKEIDEGDSNCLTLSDQNTTISAGERWVVRLIITNSHLNVASVRGSSSTDNIAAYA